MAIEVTWDNEEKTIIRWTYSPDWTWNDAYQARDDEKLLIDSVPHIVDALGDMRAARGVPPGALTTVVNVMTKRHERLGLTVLVGGNRFVQMMYAMIRKVHFGPLLRSRIVMAPTLEQAYQMIEEHRSNHARSVD